MNRWSGKVAVVTGASGGIGAAIARELVRNGLIVAGLARRPEKIEELASTLEDQSGKLHAVECDVSQEESVISAFGWVKENLGRIDVLVNNAGITIETTLSEGRLEDWKAVFDVNVLGLCLATREGLKIMRETGDEGLIVHVNSLAGERIPAVPGFSVYPASKRALTALAQSLRHELVGSKIRVTSITPGLVATDLMATYSTFSQEILNAMPSLKPEDIAAALIYALSTPPHVSVQEIILRPVGESW
ncbi:dehydrogenase/reductase SDR family member 11-like [Fopius arisanus]|uniref:Dehydrogenase/reductase SDR family member 11-like n=2 Tax=Braconidae TaxID=7402 RepID=A0A9R1UC35_9HYME|nr:PREDICTED: dehydrogenase/reductase SDR family member 11-like [Fopius arisanus]XP_011315391.1 PREDICTED: dehydrogenase/reductase SDR family member 11-like [Fopius arisanus]